MVTSSHYSRTLNNNIVPQICAWKCHDDSVQYQSRTSYFQRALTVALAGHPVHLQTIHNKCVCMILSTHKSKYPLPHWCLFQPLLTGKYHTCTLLHFAWDAAKEKCILVTAICASVCLSLAAFPHYCTDPDVRWGNDSGCPLVVHYWADLQLAHRFRCYDNIARTSNVSKCLPLLTLSLVLMVTFRARLQPLCKTESLSTIGRDFHRPDVLPN